MDSLYLPDYTSLYSNTTQPYLLDSAYSSSSSSSRGGVNPNTSASNVANGANTSITINAGGNAAGPNNTNTSDQAPHHATSQSHLATLQKNAQTRAVYHHSKGDHLPARRTATGGGGAGGSRWRKKDMRFYERERGFTWTGATLTEAEEKELSDEEDARAGWRDHILAYGETNIVVLGKGKTRREEEQDRIDRGGPSSHNPPVNGAAPGINGHHRGGGATTTGALPSDGNTAQSPLPNRNNATTQTQAGGAPPAPTQQQPDDNDVFLGEYTLDHGSSDGEEGGADDDGIFAGQDVDLDAGLESMD